MERVVFFFRNNVNLPSAEENNRINVHDSGSPEDIILSSVGYCLSSINRYQQFIEEPLISVLIFTCDEEKSDGTFKIPKIVIPGLSSGQQDKID